MTIVMGLAALMVAGGSFASLGSPWVPPDMNEALLLVGTLSSFLAICAVEARSAS
jgi:hypothetical protein